MYVKKIFAFILISSFIFLFSCSDDLSLDNINQSNEEVNNIIEQHEKIKDLDIIYKSVNNIDLKMDIYYPSNIKYEKSPLVVAFYGGGWISGDKTQIAYNFAPVISELLANGYTVAMPQYRYAEELSYFPAQIEDCVDAVNYLKDNAQEYNIDENSIGLMGYSAGAQLAMLATYATDEYFACLTPGDIKYCLSFAGPTKMYGEELTEFPQTTIYLIENLFNKPCDFAIDNYVTGSPYFFMDYFLMSETPLFLAHDEFDNIVPFSQSQVMYDLAVEKGIECELLKLNGFYHQINFDYNYDGEIIKTILDFIYKYS